MAFFEKVRRPACLPLKQGNQPPNQPTKPNVPPPPPPRPVPRAHAAG
jgi:hypothetical protein